MREKIIFYGKTYEENLEYLFGRNYKERIFMFKPLANHSNDPYANISSSPCGYVTYGRYIIPILLASPDEDKLRKHHKDNTDYLMKYIDIISGISFECLDKSCYGNIIIGDGAFHCLTYKELVPIIYHEIGHLVAPGFMTETDADRFAAAHVGPKNLLEALKSFESFRFSFKRNMAKTLMLIPDTDDDKIDLLMAVTLSEDSALSLYRKEYIERCKYVKGLPTMSLYLNENVIKECKDK